MVGFVLGTGHQKSVRTVVHMIEQHLIHTEGIPRKVEATSDEVDIVAERPAFKGEFESFTLTFRMGEKNQAIAESAAKLDGLCTIEKGEKSLQLTLPKPGVAATPETLAALDEFCSELVLPEVWRARGDKYRVDRISTELLFQAMIQYKASDVHLSPGMNPVFRIDGDTRNSELIGALSGVQIETLIKEIAPTEYWEEFQRDKQTSFNYHQVGMGYSRVSAFIKTGAPHCTLRFLPEVVPSFEDLHIPRKTMEHLGDLQRGLVLITGMTGSGKTTTVAAIIDYINSTKTTHIITIENPIEYVHVSKKSLISQRCLGSDVNTFNDAVTGALRHDPDVILIGEMRDPDTIRSAINAAATGHLVLSTLHSNTASEVVNRIVSFFDPVERDLVRLQLRDCLQCVICQRLVPKIGGGRIPAIEMMLKDIKAIGDGIMHGDTDLIRIGMQQSVSHSFLFEQYLHTMYKEGKIDLKHAQEASTDQSVFDQLHMGTYSIPRLDSIKGSGDHGSHKT